MSFEEELTNYDVKKVYNENTEWMTRLAVRDNLLRNDIPHVPILVEDLPKYTMLVDYEENCIKQIQTVGRLLQVFDRFGLIMSVISSRMPVKFPIDLSHLDLDEYYCKDTNNTHVTVWKQESAFKVFGTLVFKDDTIKLVASHLMPVKKTIGSWLVTYQLSKLARREFRQYCRTPELDKLIEEIWGKMRVEQKRRTQ